MAKTADQKRSNAYNRATVKKQLEETIGSSDVPYEVEGKEFLIPHPLFWSKDLKAEIEALDDDDEEGIAQAILGDQWDAFVAAGGEAEEIGQLLIVLQLNTKDSLASGRPTRR